MDDLKENYKLLLEKFSTLEKRLEVVNSKLLRSEKLKSDFLSNIKNEINNPLTSILGLVNQIVSSPENVEQTSSNASLIFGEMYALNFQIRNIFNAAEIEAGQTFPELLVVNIEDLILELVKSFSHLASKKNIKFDLDLKSDESFVSDREKLEVILSNLISNAVKFSHTNSNIVIKTYNDDNSSLCINIQDFGVGIESENLSQIYDRFRQLDTGTRKEFGGHGLGLSIAHSLIDILEGSLNMKTKFNEGTLFEIVLPLRASQDEGLMEDEVLFSNEEQEGEVF